MRQVGLDVAKKREDIQPSLEERVESLERAMFGEHGRPGVYDAVFAKNGLEDRVDGHDKILAKGIGFWAAVTALIGVLTLLGALGLKIFGGFPWLRPE